MSYKPDESVLISWMYGELDEAERAKVERYFQENPEELKTMQQFGIAKDIMSNIKDKEVIAPPLFLDDHDPKVIPFWKTHSFRTIATIAASVLLVIVAARLLDTNVNYSNGELRISFGKRQPVDQTVQPIQQAEPTLTAMDVQRMIDASNEKNQKDLDLAVRRSLDSNPEHIGRLVKQASSASQSEIRSFVASLQRDNLAQMRDYLQLSASDQRKYTDNLIVEFSKFLQEQRSQDLNMYQTRLSRLEQNTDDLKIETEQILASIISNSPQIQQSSY